MHIKRRCGCSSTEKNTTQEDRRPVGRFDEEMLNGETRRAKGKSVADLLTVERKVGVGCYGTGATFGMGGYGTGAT